MVRIVISDPEEGKAYQLEPRETQAENLIGMNVGDQFKGEEIGLSGYKLKITGGSDGEGVPMRSDVRGGGRVRALLAKGPGYKPKREGERRRKTVRGNRVSEQIVQLNAKIIEKGEEPIEQILGLESSEVEAADEVSVEEETEESKSEE